MWSLPGPADAPTDDLQLQLEVFRETILLRGFGEDSQWVRTVSADGDRQRVHPAPGLLLGAAAPGCALVEPGRDRALGGPMEAAAGRVGGPATGGVQAPRTAPASHAGAGLRLLAGPRALGSMRPGAGPQTPSSSSSGPPPSTSSLTGGPAPGSHRFPEDVRQIPESFFQSFFLSNGRQPEPLQEAPRQPARAMGGIGWKGRISGGGPCSPLHGGPRHGGLRRETWPPLVKHRGRWATWSTTPPDSPESRGSATTTWLGAGGVYVQSESANLTARIPVGPCDVRGLAPVAEKVDLTHGRIPAGLFEVGAALVPEHTVHRAVLRRAVERALLPAGGARTGRDGNVPRIRAARRGGGGVPLPRDLPLLLLGHRQQGRAGVPNLRRRRTP